MFKLSRDCAQWQPAELYTLEGQTVLWFFIIFYYLDCTKCKFPDFSLYSQYSFFSLTFNKIPWICKVWNFSDFPWPLDTLTYVAGLNNSKKNQVAPIKIQVALFAERYCKQ